MSFEPTKEQIKRYEEKEQKHRKWIEESSNLHKTKDDRPKILKKVEEKLERKLTDEDLEDILEYTITEILLSNVDDREVVEASLEEISL